MKQGPTKRQWDRVSTKDRNKFWEKINIDNGNPNRIPTIGELMAYLKKDEKLCDRLLHEVKNKLNS